MNMNQMSLFRLMAVCALLAGVSLSAHHSISAEFDESKIVTITGTVTKMEWVNPHAHFYVDGEDTTNHRKGEFVCDLTPPAILMRKGWTRNSLKPGDVVTVKGPIAKDNPFSVYGRSVSLKDGAKVFEGATEPDVR
jgi:hypothetical protein